MSMTSVQTTIQFPVKKKCSFYATKNVSTQDFTNSTARVNSSAKYTPTVKKIMVVSSSESESDSDTENAQVRSTRLKNVCETPKRTRKSSDSDNEHELTPPKLRKPQTPKTPSTLLNQLHLDSPAGEGNEHLTPKRLFGESTKKYQSARKALHSSVPENLPGREVELAELSKFFKEHLQTKSSGSLYISGPPGTGKTASLSTIMLQQEFKASFKIVYVNCTTMKSAGAIYSTIISELEIPPPKAAKNSKAVIEKYLVTSHKMILLVLDELDQLESKRQTVLYSIFEWPSIPKSKVLLVGIANALDLTDRILPRLQARCELKPKLMHFAPYTKQQIANIISERLKDANVSDIFNGVAVQLMAGKVAAISGDIRRALDISRRVVELAESQKSAQVLQPTMDNATNNRSPKKLSCPIERPVELKEVMAVLNSVYGASHNIEQSEDTFPLQQKLLLCSVMLILNKAHNKDLTVYKVHEVYKKVCQKQSIVALDISEFVGLCELVETRGVLRIAGKKGPRLSKVHLQWDQEELGAALQDKKLMGQIINDITCL